MKTKTFLTIMPVLFVAIIISLTGCKKKNTPNILEKSYFSVQNGVFTDSEIPASSASASGPVISSVYGNTTILEGGSNPISLQTASTFKEVIVGVDNIKGYYYVPAPGSGNSVLLILLFSQTLENDDFTIVLALRNAQGLVSDHKTIEVSKIEAGTGVLQVSLSWDKANDVDLHLVEPNGEEIYYSNDYSENGGELDVDSNPDCDLDYINNENITYSEEAVIEPGKYTVRVDLYSNCGVPANTNFIVSARYKGKIVTPATGANPYTGSFTPSEEDGGGSGDGREIMTFNISGGKSESFVEKRIKFVYPESDEVKTKSRK